MKLRVAVLMGGPSAEAEVSRVSAGEVARALKASGHAVDCMELDDRLIRPLLAFKPDVVFPALHGPPGEDGTVQGFLEILGLPYVGSDVHGSAVAMDKAIAKSVFRAAGLPVIDDLVLAADSDPQVAAEQVREVLGDRVVIKPLRQGSAIGVTPLANGGDLVGPLERAFTLGDGVLVERYVLGHEITVGVLDLWGKQMQALPVIEITTAGDQWYDYTNRYQAGASEHVIPAPLGDALNEELQRISLVAHRRLELRDLSRADFIVTDDGQIVLLEVNTMPGMTPTSLFPDGARAVDLDFPTLMDSLVVSAFRRATLEGAAG